MNYNIIRIEEAGLSNRSKNFLKKNGVDRVEQMVALKEEDIRNIKGLGTKSIDEILNKINEYRTLINNQDHTITIDDLLRLPEYKEKIIEYVQVHDTSLYAMQLSDKAYNPLNKAGLHYLSEILFYTENDFHRIDSLGKKKISEIIDKRNTYIHYLSEGLLGYCVDHQPLYDHKYLSHSVMDVFRDRCDGLSVNQIYELLNVKFNEDEIIDCLMELQEEGMMESYARKFYRIFPSIMSFSDTIETPREHDIFLRTLGNGETLEEVGGTYGISRERIRQLQKRAIDTVKQNDLMYHESVLFSEDRYGYLYKNYAVNPDLFENYFHDSTAYKYNSIKHKKRGEKELSDAISDPQIDPRIIAKVQEYLDRNCIVISNRKIVKTRANIENYLIETRCQEETEFDDFVEIYEQFLVDNHLEEDESLNQEREKKATRENKLSTKGNLLWKSGRKLRYYNLEAYDFTELLETIDLKQYSNCEVSTLKFFNDYPDLMKEYDIRDHYELHNLLKKIMPADLLDTLDPDSRMPNLRFGNADYKITLYNLLLEKSPISKNDLLDEIYQLYGFEPLSYQANHSFEFLDQYYHNGIYDLTLKKMDDVKLRILSSYLKEDFYFIDEIRDIYMNIFPDGELSDVNVVNLKSLGFKVYAQYAIRNAKNREEYFMKLLLDQDTQDLAALRKKYSRVPQLSTYCMELKRQYQIIEYEPNHSIKTDTIPDSQGLRKFIQEYCDYIYSQVEDHSYFTVQSLKEKGIERQFHSVSYGDYFYASILAMDPRFTFTSVFDQIVLYKGNDHITRQSFILALLEKQQAMPVLDLIESLNLTYGCNAGEDTKYDIYQLLNDTDITIDPVHGILYNSYANYKKMNSIE